MSLLSTEPRITADATPRSTWTSPWKRPTVVFGLIVASFWLIVVFTVHWWAPYAPLEAVGERLQPPSRHHWLGTDALSRDVFTRTLYGARQTLPVSVAVIVSAVSIGTALGSIAGFVGGRVESVIMRSVDITLAFPPIF
nr:D,D-dipeptide ABC transporter permease [Actinomycetota bacterium]